ncbi:unnamed protein product [Triticum turgidum subsp. durum]|uniref:F-box domain-containing protein n=1 Tax=Triticum turgidum subsp. durum TaxID=4567 RepID=A0A9R1BWQ1_TRITD|nr:unnamed protein product [Triticum turgidum subsp. durum]
MEGAEKGEICERNTKPRLDDHPQVTAAGVASLFNIDLILEILSRLPARSVHRFKCVSMLWRDLIADPANHKKLPQTLAGFLYTSFYNSGYRHHFAGFSGGAASFNPSLPYLHPNKDEGITLVDACNGLLLYRRYNSSRHDYHFVVCNPATGRWVELPPQPQTQERMNRLNHTAGLAFDPAVSSHFHVLCFERTFPETLITGVNIYSSRTGGWIHRDSGIVEKATLFRSKCVFVGGMLYIMGNLEDINGEYVLVGVDMEGKVWKTIRVPYGSKFGTIGLSKGCLHYAIAPLNNNNEILVSEIALWCLKDCDSKQWVLKHTASIDTLISMTWEKYRVVEIHPDCDTIFLAQCGGDTLVSYDMWHQKVGCIINLEKNSVHKFLPYVPLFSEPLADAEG